LQFANQRHLFENRGLQVGGRTIGHYRKNQIIFAQGDPADSIFYVQTGKIKITVVSKQGKEPVVAILGTDDFFGEGCPVGQPRRLATATAMTDSAKNSGHRRDSQRGGIFRDVHCPSLKPDRSD
jgi:CRP-like cAMP-binding protein